MSFHTIPFFRQQTDYTCGPASLQMGLAAIGIRRSQQALAEIAKTSKAHGTARRSLVDAARECGADAVVLSGTTLRQLRRLLRREIPVIVNYIEPEHDVGHFALVTSVTWTHVIMNDPWHGRDFAMSIPRFLFRWYDESHRHPRWAMAIAPPDALIVDFPRCYSMS